MDIQGLSRKDIGNLGETVAVEYLHRRGFEIIARNVTAKTGELDIVARIGECIHVVEVKTSTCFEFPEQGTKASYNPGYNLHSYKLKKVVRTAQWYLAERGWEGEWQIDGALVWLRFRDGIARVSYFPQILE